ncbi:MAG: biotin--[acetyl-CoA-carboxylase] ligase [Propioniciclava sp.]|uniref:biotin--[acetyl-CoA-carboxylase] ligase n=1 Tax=Propioniciclava sp. TaxID=2038686 RepID=UPI0039E4676A
MTDFLDAPALRASVLGGLWRQLDVVAFTGSTNADLAAAARAGAESGRVLATGDQRTGRGRLARSWGAPPDTSFACSVLVAPRRPMAEWGLLPLLVGMAVTDGVREATGLDAALKWPNDVLVDDRKLCGILCESVFDAPGRPHAVLGFGLNVALSTEQLPVPTATSTRLEGSDASATAILAACLVALERWFTFWDAGGDIIAPYRERCGTLGRDVVVHLAGGPVTGRAVAVDAHGGIVVATPTGHQTFVAGDVEHLRRA